jgi:hypothetical protein
VSQACSLCTADTRVSHRGRVLAKYDVAYLYCDRCGLLQTEEPYWLDEAYADVIALSDTALLTRNISMAIRLTAVLGLLFDRNARYVDAGGGYGVLTRLMRDVGFDFYWSDPYCTNLFANGFEASPRLTPFAAVTAFEVLEHVYDPLAFVRRTLAAHGSSTFIFSTQLFDGQPPGPDWFYYSGETGQHVTFYQPRTLRRMADALSLNVYSLGCFHLFTDRTLNTGAFKACASRLSFLMFPAMRAWLRSRSITDHDAAVARLRKEGAPASDAGALQG